MSQFDDYLDGHQGRVARLALAMWPDDADAVKLALVHDDGEWATGDIPQPIKERAPLRIREWIEDEELIGRAKLWAYPGAAFIVAIKGGLLNDRLTLCDILDRLMFVQHKAPHLLPGEFAGDIAKVEALAISLNVADAVAPVLRGMRG